MRKRERERERERERDRKREGERQRDRDGEARNVCRQQMDKRTGRQKDKSTENEFKKTEII